MGYELHITRADDWTESEATPITLDEWRSIVDSDPDMQMLGHASVELSVGVLRVEGEGIAVWTQYSHDDPRGNRAWFHWFEGSIDVKNPDDEIIGKMVDIASRLQARVQGDDGEYYPRVTNSEAQASTPVLDYSNHRPHRRYRPNHIVAILFALVCLPLGVLLGGIGSINFVRTLDPATRDKAHLRDLSLRLIASGVVLIVPGAVYGYRGLRGDRSPIVE